MGATLGAFAGIWWGALGLGALVASLLVEALGVRGALVGIGSLLPALAVAAGPSLARSCGERPGALLRDVPRTATVSALDDTRLLAVDRDEFPAAAKSYPSSRAGVGLGSAVDRRRRVSGVHLHHQRLVAIPSFEADSRVFQGGLELTSAKPIRTARKKGGAKQVAGHGRRRRPPHRRPVPTCMNASRSSSSPTAS